jgi:hypothetical protein
MEECDQRSLRVRLQVQETRGLRIASGNRANVSGKPAQSGSRRPTNPSRYRISPTNAHCRRSLVRFDSFLFCVVKVDDPKLCSAAHQFWLERRLSSLEHIAKSPPGAIEYPIAQRVTDGSLNFARFPFNDDRCAGPIPYGIAAEIIFAGLQHHRRDVFSIALQRFDPPPGRSATKIA